MTNNKELFLRAFERHGSPHGLSLPGSVCASIGQTKEGRWRMVYEIDPFGQLEGHMIEADTPEELAFAIIINALSLSAQHYNSISATTGSPTPA